MLLYNSLKTKKENKNWRKKKENSRHIYQNKLDKGFFPAQFSLGGF